MDDHFDAAALRNLKVELPQIELLVGKHGHALDGGAAVVHVGLQVLQKYVAVQEVGGKHHAARCPPVRRHRHANRLHCHPRIRRSANMGGVVDDIVVVVNNIAVFVNRWVRCQRGVMVVVAAVRWSSVSIIVVSSFLAVGVVVGVGVGCAIATFTPLLIFN